MATLVYADTFTDTAGTALTSHESDSEHTYTGSSGATINAEGRVYGATSGTHLTKVVEIECEPGMSMQMQSHFATTNGDGGIAWCIQTQVSADDAYYHLRWNNQDLQWYRFTSSGATLLGTYAVSTNAGEDYPLVTVEDTGTGWQINVGAAEDVIPNSERVLAIVGQIGIRLINYSASGAGAQPDYVSYSISGFAVTGVTTAAVEGVSSQYIQATIALTGFTAAITSVSFVGGEAWTILESDPSDEEITVRAPGAESSGSKTLRVSDGVNQADYPVEHTQTHTQEFPAPGTSANDNSFAAGQGGGNEPWFEPPPFPLLDTSATYNLLLKAGVTGVDQDNLVLDVNDVVEAELGTPEGTVFEVTFQKIYNNGVTATWMVTLTVGEGGDLEVSNITRPVFRDIFRPVFKGVA
ncbi:hypothetical protein EUZ85_19335 [Hahella sp. KA22]|uniref:hypothetical protein n=1 Tax=Hahella sp. KA22 TaxID=1628392 RepID=UPI000FDF1EB9|nr:hypothetical protein [Hahella sp. KA22]AZZ92759.1 hypothetical protein ENC22_16755 [Hahella sp. KA22]QAY56133.1 hypothetical protein EUZ85_19335 [Hahella sp. KA22]